jgi:hypothetical protein
MELYTQTLVLTQAQITGNVDFEVQIPLNTIVSLVVRKWMVDTFSLSLDDG